MKVLICGGRNYWDYRMLCSALERIKITAIISGGAQGADQLAERYAADFQIPIWIYRADWDRHGKAAGPIRNGIMLEDNPDIALVVALPGGRGTADMIRQAKQRDVRVLEIL